MSANLDLLNAVKTQIVRVATDNNISLQDEFGTPAEFQKFVFAFAIRGIMEIGQVSVEKAYELVMGEGSWATLADDVWATVNGQ